MTSEQPYRVAVYWAPHPSSGLWQAGSQWLGRDAATDRALQPPEVPGIAPDLFARLTEEPRRYGWHATLKPPFRLASGVTLASVEAAVAQLAQRLKVVEMPPLRVARLGQFLALRPEAHPDDLEHLAATCVQALHALAQPLSVEELARRRRVTLTPRQSDLLERWGYPWVMEEFRFHCSLTGSLAALDEMQVATLRSCAQRTFDDFPAASIESLAVFVEPTPGASFCLHRHWRIQP